MAKSPTGTQVADLLRMPVDERRARLRSVVSRTAGTAALRAEIRAASRWGQPKEDTAELADGWQDRVLDRLRETELANSAEAAHAQDLFAKLLKQPAARRETLVRNSRKFHTWSLCRLLSLESLNALFRDPQQAIELARLATDISEGAYLELPSQALLNDLKGCSWTYRGNAHRALSQFPEAEQAFKRAHDYLREGTGDPAESARLANLKATLRLKQSRFTEAERLFDHSIRLFLSIGDRHAAGAPVLGKAVLLWEIGKTDEATRQTQRALEMIDPQRDPRLHNIARHNMIANLRGLGALQEASAEIGRLKHAHAQLGDTISVIRLECLEAEIAFEKGEFDAAIALQHHARNQFAANGLLLDVAFTTLDLAAFHLKLNQTSETKRLAAESLPLFQSLGIQREAIAAWLVFQQAAEREMVTLELVKEVANYLRASRANPELKFRG